MSVANVKLNVYSVERSLTFYRDILGFQLIGKSSDESAFLSAIGSPVTDFPSSLRDIWKILPALRVVINNVFSHPGMASEVYRRKLEGATVG